MLRALANQWVIKVIPCARETSALPRPGCSSQKVRIVSRHVKPLFHPRLSAAVSTLE
jgi:hypothetical protein